MTVSVTLKASTDRVTASSNRPRYSYRTERVREGILDTVRVIINRIGTVLVPVPHQRAAACLPVSVVLSHTRFIKSRTPACATARSSNAIYLSKKCRPVSRPAPVTCMQQWLDGFMPLLSFAAVLYYLYYF